MGKRDFYLLLHKKGRAYTIELEQDLNRNTNATKSKSDPKVAWKKKTTHERPYNFRLLEVAKMGIGYRDPNFKFPKWKTAWNCTQTRMVMMSLVKGGLLYCALHCMR